MTMFSSDDYRYMQMALDLAEKGIYTTTPNPRVGCLVVKDGVIVGQGYHRLAGHDHAEVIALNVAQEKAQGATVYVTLEPCSHTGRTPPCVNALIKARVARVIAAMQDPNPLVAGQGLQRLAAAGIDTAWGLLEKSAIALNKGFVSRMMNNKPWVRLKIAASLDGKTALASGESQWITSPAAREDVQRLRARSCAILTGIGTVLSDDPALTVRSIDIGRQPLRVVVDSTLRISPSAAIFYTLPVLIVTLQQDTEKMAALKAHGVEVYVMSAPSIDLAEVLALLAERGCNEVLVEAGMTVNGALLNAKLVDEIVLYQAPVLLGYGARDVMNVQIATLSDKIQATQSEVIRVGSDLRWTLQLHD
jgi:diaminohydroxyphosphoribosylaminopyrimidine deaminase/5-amino-6-(5-phosphoribosylamino)uracil reductase